MVSLNIMSEIEKQLLYPNADSAPKPNIGAKLPNPLERWTIMAKKGKLERTDYAPTEFCKKDAKSRSLLLFQSGIIGSAGFIDIVSTIIIWS